MKIDLNLIKETRETTDWLLALPDKLVSAVMKPQECFLRRRERIDRLKELVEIREIGKAIQSLYLSKGDLVQWVQEVQSARRFEDAVYVKELFRTIMHESQISGKQSHIRLFRTLVWARSQRCSLLGLSWSTKSFPSCLTSSC
jgi:hypothetical protein